MITITDSAAEQVRNIIASEDKQGHHLRMGIAGGGCSGFQYFLGLDLEINETDEAMDYEGFKLLISKKDAPFLNGSTLDYSSDPANTGFVFNNPNAPKPPECGGSCHC